MLRTVELRKDRAGLVKEAGAILTAAEAAKRSLTADEEKRFNELHAQADKMLAEIEQRERQDESERSLAASRFERRTPGGGGDESGPVLLGVTAEGHEVRGYRVSDPLPASANADESRATLGGLVRGLSTGNWRGYETEQRTLASGSGSIGGYLTPQGVSSRFIDLARKQARLVQAGAITVPIEGESLTVARLLQDATAYWRHENQPVTASELSFDGAVFRPKVVGAFVVAPLELVEDAPNLGQIVETSLSAAIALEVDRVGLRGVGAAAEPLGILNTVGVQTITSVGAPTYADFSSAVQKIAEQNGQASAAILAPRDLGTLDRLADSTTQPLRPPESWATLRKFSTNQIPTTLGGGSNESESYVGGFENVWVGVRKEITIEASKHASDSTNSAFKNLQVWIRAWTRVDFVVARPAHLVVLSGITT